MISIITPTWNRANLINRLYESLIRQTNKNFEWIVVDDGSTDNTKEIVDGWIKENKINIHYYLKPNGGKHTALNLAVQKASKELCFIVDSDDYISDDAVETIIADYDEIKGNDKISGIGYLRATLNGDVIGKEYTKDGVVDTFVNQRYNNNVYGDKAEVYKTSVLKKYTFPEFENEKFLSESVVWCEISKDYTMKFLNKKIYFCEYQQGGLSDNVRKRLFKNPKGACECYRAMCHKQFNLKNKIKFLLLYICHGIECGKSRQELKKGVDCKFLFGIVYPFGKILHKKRSKVYG